ncbi:glycosyltransferase family 4 protein [Arthrobacter sp. AQ5-05]|uniref:glycosyltransferase family 4 protein n=1 Tax=Arthrobacter sp. AQ5-05 TaxID=2184581 RepID=UPI0012B67776|nr:glycosyltransferase family 4 protein [Arthrobacter sp. AQ5-05]
MRVVVFTTWYPDAGAPSTAPFNLSHAQAIATRHDVRVIHVRLGGAGAIVSEEFGGVPVTRIPLSPRRPWGYLELIRHTVAALRHADILHTMAFTSAAVAAPIQVFTRTPWVHTEHWSGMAEPATVSRAWKALSWLRYVLKLPDAVTAVSGPQAEQLRRFSRRGLVSVVPNVVSVNGTLAQRRGTGPGAVKLVGVGGLIERKRPGLAVAALRILRAGGLDASLTWVGDGPLREALATQNEDLRGHLRMTGKVTPDQVRAELSEADVFLLPTAHETFCMAAAEAVATGVPAVVTDLPAVRDFLTEENSVLVSDATAAGYAAAVRTALEKFAQVPAAAIAGTIAGRFSPQLIAEQFTAVYARVGRPRQ